MILESPVFIHGMRVKNRIVFPPMSTKFAAPDGTVTERMLNYYEERAKGGAGLIVVEATYIHPSGNSFSSGLGLSDDRMVPGLAELVRRVKRHGAKISIQLQHGGRAARSEASGQAVQLVSYIPGVTPYENIHVLTEEDIRYLTECWGQAALRARAAGFDSVELHGAHGYLISQFFSPYTNHRTDAYGGSLENRMRFPLEVYREVRRVLGEDFPIAYRMSASEGISGGISVEDSVALAQRLVHEAPGIDALHVSVGFRETNFMVSPPSCVQKGWNAPFSRAIRDGIQAAVPVIVAGQVRDELVAEEILSRGDADMTAMGRPLIADPHLPEKVAAGKTGTIIRCIACNEGCVGGSARGVGIGCALNPLTGFEKKFDLSPVAAPKKVLIAGAGPAGMQAALSARLRGHQVTVYEKNALPGGLLNIAQKPPFKSDIQNITDYFCTALRENEVKIHLNQAMTPQILLQEKPDHVILATGSQAVFPGFCRVPSAKLAEQVLSGEAVGENVVIIGGGLIGVETADFLASQGKKVTVIEMRDSIAADMEGRTRRYMLERLKKYGTKLLTKTQVLEITEDTRVCIRSAEQSEQWLEGFESLVVAVGYTPHAETELLTCLRSLGIPFSLVGDCAVTGKIMTAIESGFKAGISI